MKYRYLREYILRGVCLCSNVDMICLIESSFCNVDECNSDVTINNNIHFFSSFCLCTFRVVIMIIHIIHIRQVYIKFLLAIDVYSYYISLNGTQN